jgi:radical SAM protein with 4Fe4S-binding SPASM domain
MNSAVEDKFRMDGHKLLWHLDRVADWQKGNRVAPLHIDMGIVTGCNMACTYCYGVIQNRKGYGTDDPSGMYAMPKEAALNMFRDAAEVGVRSIALIGEGENTLHPHFYEILEESRDIDLDLSLATNGVRIPDDHAETLLRRLSWLRVNISAADHDSFLKIHKVPQFDRVVANVRNLMETRKRLDLTCTVGLQMIVTYDNVDQIAPLSKLGRELGVDYFVIKACSDTSDGTLDSPNEDYLEMTSIFREAETNSSDSYSVVVKWEKLGNGGWKEYPVCFGTQFILAVSGDGSVFPCGHWFDVRRDEFKMGNVVEGRFRDIVASERYWQVQEQIQTVDVNRDCESNCRQHYANQFLSPLRTDPPHKNFV